MLGEYKNGVRHGKGKYTSKEGDIFEGFYMNGKKNGYGTYKWTNGQVI